MAKSHISAQRGQLAGVNRSTEKGNEASSSQPVHHEMAASWLQAAAGPRIVDFESKLAMGYGRRADGTSHYNGNRKYQTQFTLSPQEELACQDR